ncbi:MAG: MoaD/ThiS family protein [Anaerolineales bacterium]|nr:MoaD/ThiS family protein [Anaerolineales bacterium]MCJ7659619.1 MoaD/ThiS family protein [Anaerolineales bacterium]
MTARLLLRDQEFHVKHGMKVRDTLSRNDISPESVLATREGELITDDEIIQDGDTITLIAVISGGMH